jgi:predicted acyltransferase
MLLRDTRRLVAIDIFRGLTIAIMLLVNSLPNFEQAYPLLLHAPWAGLTIADLAFPGFVFIMGVSASLWFAKHRDDSFGEKFSIILKRSVLLFLFGLILNQLPLLLQHCFSPEAGGSLLNDIMEHGRVMGVLQRLGLVYFFGMIITWWLRSEKHIAIMSLLLLALSSTCFHLYDTTNPFSPDNNISMLIDGIFPGAAHCYLGKPFDPEGLYGTIAATASFLWGMLAGRQLTLESAPIFERVLMLLVSGTLLLILGGVWSYLDIISKQLWTAPYVLFTSGGFMWGLGLLQMALSLFPDFMKWLFTPCRLFGTNPLFFFIVPDRLLLLFWYIKVQGTAIYPWLWEHTLLGVLGAPLSILVFALTWVLLWLPVANFLYKRQIIFKL